MPDLTQDLGEGPEIDPLTGEQRDLGNAQLEAELPESGAARTEDGVVFPDADAEGEAVTDRTETDEETAAE